MKIILASQSPRRKELLHMLFDDFEIHTAKDDGSTSETEPEKYVMALSRNKALDVEVSLKEACNNEIESPNVDNGMENAKVGNPSENCIIAADTIVYLNGLILGKPKDKADAVKMLKSLQGSTHQVYTGVTIICESLGITDSFYEKTNVTFSQMTAKEIEEYVATGEPMDKAGAYGIQGLGGKYIAGIAGDYNNVVGLPVAHLYQFMKEKGIIKNI